MGAETGICRPSYMCSQMFGMEWCFRDPITSVFQPTLHTGSWSMSLLWKPKAPRWIQLSFVTRKRLRFILSHFYFHSSLWLLDTFLFKKKYESSVLLGIDVNMSTALSPCLLMPMPSEFKKLKQGIAFWNECHVNNQAASQKPRVKRMKAELRWRAFKSS